MDTGESPPSPHTASARQADFQRLSLMSVAERLAVPAPAELVKVQAVDDAAAPLPLGTPPLFKPSHNEIVFQNWRANETHEVVLTLKNTDKAARKVKVEPSSVDWLHFAGVKADALPQAKVNAGGETTFLVRFTPQAETDLVGSVQCVSDKDKITIPIRCIAPRGVLDFPESVAFPDVSVNSAREQTIAVRNLGLAAADCELQLDVGADGSEAESGFSLQPARLRLAPTETAEVRVRFEPTTAGQKEAALRVRYSTGETVTVDLHGAAERRDVSVSAEHIHAETLTVSMNAQYEFSITNNSGTPVQFRVSRHETAEELQAFLAEERESILAQESVATENVELARGTTLPQSTDELASSDSAAQSSLEEAADAPEGALGSLEAISSPAAENAQLIGSLRGALEWARASFLVRETSGTVNANSAKRMALIFDPLTSGVHQQRLFVHVQGLEQPLIVSLEGEAIGPEAIFEADELEVGAVYVRTPQTFDVYLRNTGESNANFAYVEGARLFADYVTVTPLHGVLKLGETKAISVTFASPDLGSFREVLEWRLEGSSKPINLLLAGTVMAPEYALDCERLDFGSVAAGFPYTKVFRFENQSEVPFRYDFSAQCAFRGVSIQIQPAAGVLQPHAEELVCVLVTAETAIPGASAELQLGIEHVGRALSTIEIAADFGVPDLVLVTKSITLGKCFLGYEYTSEVTIVNSSAIPGRCVLQAPTVDGDAPAAFRNTIRDVSEIVVDANSSSTVTLTTQILQIGSVSYDLAFRVAGNNATLVCGISAIGVGPDILINPASGINWGKVAVLDHDSREVTVHNKSLISAQFSCTLRQGARSIFLVEPASGVIAPGQSRSLVVTACAIEDQTYTDTLAIEFADTGVTSLELKAVAEGSCVTVDDDVKDIHLGNLVRDVRYQKSFYIVNRGKSNQVLQWETEVVESPLNAKSSIRGVILISPNRLLLKPQQRYLMHIHGTPDLVGYYEQNLVCYGTHERVNDKRKLISLKVAANCIRPESAATRATATGPAPQSMTATSGATLVSGVTAKLLSAGTDLPTASAPRTSSPTRAQSPTRASAETRATNSLPSSEYLRESLMPLQERLARQTREYKPVETQSLLPARTANLPDCKVAPGDPIFKPNYSLIHLQRYEVGKEYDISLTLRNMDKVARRLKMEDFAHPCFVVKMRKSDFLSSGKVAPGMEVLFHIKFRPLALVDYSVALWFVTERERFKVDVRAVGAGGVLNLPDELQFLDNAVNSVARQTIYVKNVGAGEAEFTVIPSEHFHAEPAHAVVAGGANVLVFEPKVVGRYNERVVLQYGNGGKRIKV